jgi:putative acetyltransferase
VSGALELRPERPADADALRALHLAAFAPSTVEAAILDALRADGDLVAALSLVAMREGAIAGHVAVSRAWVDIEATADDDGAAGADAAGTPGASSPRAVEVLALGPIGVEPALQRGGVGAALMRACLAAAARTSWPLIALLGHADYYPRFGFESADALGIRCPYPVSPEHWMAFRLPAYDPALRGTFRYAAAFSLA